MGNPKLFVIAALVLSLVVGVNAQKKEAGVAKGGASVLMTPLGKNAQGFEEYRNGKDSSTMVRIPAGEFAMGSNNYDEKPSHTVYLDAYYIDKYEVTNAQYKKFCDATNRFDPEFPHFGGKTDPGYFKNYPNNPVVNVTWEEASAYSSWAGKRLPTEAEWEKAARGTDGRKYPWGNKWDASKCNSKESGINKTTPVGSYPQGASPYGVMDMAGNVWEWCQDRYDHNYYQVSSSSNPTGPSSGAGRILRGGCWANRREVCTTTLRNCAPQEARFDFDGFRCAQSIEQRFDTTATRDTSKLTISPPDTNKVPKSDEFVKCFDDPIPLNTPHPKYPAKAKKEGREGKVLVQILVDLDGSVMQTRVAKSSGQPDLDKAATEGAKKFKFKPAMAGDPPVPVRVWVTMPIDFHLH